MKNEIKEYSETEAALTDLESKYAIVQDCTTKEGYEFNRKAMKEVRGYRTSLDKMRLSLGEEARNHVKMLNSEAKRITDRLVAIEDPMKEAKKAVDDEADRLKAEEDAREVARIEKIEEKVKWVKNAVHCQRTVKNISYAISQVNKIDPEDGFDEYSDACVLAKKMTLNDLEEMLVMAEEQEAEAIKVKALAEQQAEKEKALEEERAELNRQKAEMEAEKQKIVDEKAEIERGKREEIERAIREKEAKEEAERVRLAEIEEEKKQKKLDEEEAEIKAKKKAEYKAKIKADSKRLNKDAVSLMGYSGSLSTLISDFHSLSCKCEPETKAVIEEVMHKLVEAKDIIAESPITQSQGW